MRQGHQVEIATVDDPAAACGADLACPVHELGPARFGDYSYSPSLLPWLRDNLGRFDAVVVNGLWQHHGAAVRSSALAAGVPYFVFPHGMLDPWFRRSSPAKHLKKQLYWWLVEQRVLRDACAVLFTCEEERLLARDTFAPYSVREAVVSYGTAGPEDDIARCREAFLLQFPALRDQRFLLFMGRLHPKKGVDLLLRAMARWQAANSPIPLVIAGPDNDGELARLRALAQQLGVQGVTWTGILTGEIKWGAMHAAEALVLPSHQENFGIVVAEALACGVPALISNKVNIWREIEQDGAGLVAEDTEDGTFQLLQAWANLDAPARRLVAHNARRTFETRFHIDAAARSLVAAMSDLAKTPAARVGAGVSP